MRNMAYVKERLVFMLMVLWVLFFTNVIIGCSSAINDDATVGSDMINSQDQATQKVYQAIRVTIETDDPEVAESVDLFNAIPLEIGNTVRLSFNAEKYVYSTRTFNISFCPDNNSWEGHYNCIDSDIHNSLLEPGECSVSYDDDSDYYFPGGGYWVARAGECTVDVSNVIEGPYWPMIGDVQVQCSDMVNYKKIKDPNNTITFWKERPAISLKGTGRLADYHSVHPDIFELDNILHSIEAHITGGSGMVNSLTLWEDVTVFLDPIYANAYSILAYGDEGIFPYIIIHFRSPGEPTGVYDCVTYDIFGLGYEFGLEGDGSCTVSYAEYSPHIASEMWFSYKDTGCQLTVTEGELTTYGMVANLRAELDCPYMFSYNAMTGAADAELIYGPIHLKAAISVE